MGQIGVRAFSIKTIFAWTLELEDREVDLEQRYYRMSRDIQ